MLAAAACAETEFGFTDPELTGRIDVSFEVPGAVSASVSGGRLVSTDVTVGVDPSLVVDSVDVVIRELQVGRQGTECAFGSIGNSTDDGGDGRDCEELFISTIVESVPVDEGRNTLVTDGRIEPGTFDRVAFRFNRLERDQNEDLQIISDRGDLVETSVLVVGTFDGEDFTLKLDPDEEVVVNADVPLTIEDEGSGAVALVWNVSRWFDDGQGGVISPVAAGDDESLEDQIEANIVGTMEVRAGQTSQ